MRCYLVLEMQSDESCEVTIHELTKYYGVAFTLAQQLAKQCLKEIDSECYQILPVSTKGYRQGFKVTNGGSWAREFQIKEVDYKEDVSMESYYNECIEEVERNYAIKLTDKQRRQVIEELDDDEELNETLWFKTFDTIEKVYGKDF